MNRYDQELADTIEGERLRDRGRRGHCPNCGKWVGNSYFKCGCSQNARVLAVLKDHRPHSIQEIQARAGTMSLNSRIAWLRVRGNPIVHHRETSQHVTTHYYRLLSTPPDPSPGGVESGPVANGAWASASPLQTSGPETPPSPGVAQPPRRPPAVTGPERPT